MEPVQDAGGQEAGDGDAAALDQDPAEAAAGEGVQQPPRRETLVVARHFQGRHPVPPGPGRGAPGSSYPQGGRRAVGEHAPVRRHPPAAVHHHPRGAAARAGAYGQPGIVRDDRAGPDDHGVGQGPQPVQVAAVLLPGDVVRVAGTGRDEPVHALPELGEDAVRACQAQREVAPGQPRRPGGGGLRPAPLPVSTGRESGGLGIPGGPDGEQPVPGPVGIEGRAP
ncbi:hypothetical protein SSP35_09_02030 [Streptomyces sp. NBRC 110611]|nr:hypothetical protein SSP35_09_02030 [Streptomyces sp. NBRC 110611]